MWIKVNLSLLLLCHITFAQVDIHQKSKDGFIRVPVDEARGTKEIYTSMHQLGEFFEEEKNYVEDIKTIIEKKLVTQSSVTGLGETYFKKVLNRFHPIYQIHNPLLNLL